MDHGGMPGMMTEKQMAMMTEEQMAEMEAWTGSEFDELFLESMIEHHTGAVQMAQTE